MQRTLEIAQDSMFTTLVSVWGLLCVCVSFSIA